MSLPDDLVAAARDAVAAGEAASISAYVAAALSEQQRHGKLAELLAEMAAQSGPPSAEDRAWARSALGLE